MAKPEWGVKRICPNCGARYYDLRKDPPVCPSCGTQFDPEALLKSRRARPVPVDDVVKKVPVGADEDEVETDREDEDVADLEEAEDEVAVEDIEEDAEEVAEDEDDVLIEDTSELGEDDMDEVVDVEGEDEEER
ncbi:MAG TPA: TIGR02300 family protein [Azospirillum sp.]|nr:TIGR02300 family protein [Azospirillum sp.]